MTTLPNTDALPPHRRRVWVEPAEGAKDLVPVEEVRAVCAECGAPATLDPDTFDGAEGNTIHGWVYGSVTSRCSAHPGLPSHTAYRAYRARMEGVVLVSMAVRDAAIDACLATRLGGHGTVRLYRLWDDPRARLWEGREPLPKDAYELVVLRNARATVHGPRSAPLEEALDSILRSVVDGPADIITGGEIREEVWVQIREAIGGDDPVEATLTVLEEGGALDRVVGVARSPEIGQSEAAEYAAWARFLGDEPAESVSRPFYLAEIGIGYGQCPNRDCVDHDHGNRFVRAVDTATGAVTLRCAECGTVIEPGTDREVVFTDPEESIDQIPVGREA